MTEPVIDPNSVVINKLTEVLERLSQQPRNEGRQERIEVVKLKVPQYSGVGDVDFFLQQFDQVAEASGWSEAISTLKIREVLTGKAQECGRGTDLQSIFNNLRLRFGITQREARSKLRGLRKDHKTSLQDHATEVEQLVNLAHPNLPQLYIRELVLETFTSSLGYPSLQKHLLAMRVDSLEAAIQAGNEFLEISFHNIKNDVRQVGDEMEEATPQPKVAAVESQTTNILSGMMDILQKLVTKVDNMGQVRAPNALKALSRPPPTCWQCGEVGHVRTRCTASNKQSTLQSN